MGPLAGRSAQSELFALSDDFLAISEQHRIPASPGAGEDQHGNNTDETAFPGTRWHSC